MPRPLSLSKPASLCQNPIPMIFYFATTSSQLPEFSTGTNSHHRSHNSSPASLVSPRLPPAHAPVPSLLAAALVYVIFIEGLAIKSKVGSKGKHWPLQSRKLLLLRKLLSRNRGAADREKNSPPWFNFIERSGGWREKKCAGRDDFSCGKTNSPSFRETQRLTYSEQTDPLTRRAKMMTNKMYKKKSKNSFRLFCRSLSLQNTCT